MVCACINGPLFIQVEYLRPGINQCCIRLLVLDVSDLQNEIVLECDVDWHILNESNEFIPELEVVVAAQHHYQDLLKVLILGEDASRVFLIEHFLVFAFNGYLGDLIV